MNKKSWNMLLFVLIVTVAIIFLHFIIIGRTVYLGNNTKVISIGSKIFKYNKNKKVLLKKVNVYRNNELIDGYLKSRNLDNEKELYLVSSDNKNIDIKDLIASGKLIKIDVKLPSNESDSIDESSIKEINDIFDIDLKSENVSIYKKIVHDIDNDSIDEQIIFISFVLNDISSDKIIIKDNNIIKIIDYDYDYENLMKEPQKVYDLVGIIDFNNDKNYEVVVSRINGDSQPTYYDIYSYENGKVSEIK